MPSTNVEIRSTCWPISRRWIVRFLSFNEAEPPELVEERLVLRRCPWTGEQAADTVDSSRLLRRHSQRPCRSATDKPKKCLPPQRFAPRKITTRNPGGKADRLEGAPTAESAFSPLIGIKFWPALETRRSPVHGPPEGSDSARHQSWKRSKKAQAASAGFRFRFCDGLQPILQCRPQPPAR
jgi:hypothetical protein